MRHLALLFAILLSGSSLPSAHASPPPDFAAVFGQLRMQDDYLQQLGWRLRTGNAPFCTDAVPDIGLLLQDAATFPDSAAVRQVNAIAGDFFVQSVAAHSPAERAGLKPGTEVSGVNGTAFADFPLNPAEKWRRLQDIDVHIRELLHADGSVSLMLPGGKPPLLIEGVPACPGRFELLTKYDTASANAERVAVGAKFIGLTYPENEFAAVLAHELAHVILKHPQWLDTNGRKRRDVRATEREADELMPWLLVNAGYEPDAAVRFMQR
ncbi:MAG: M48 family metalloprotease, partial [Pontixanthobacter sp.]